VLAHTVDRVRHLIRRADRGWEDLGELAGDPRQVADLAAAGVGGDLHVLATTASGGLDHAVWGGRGVGTGGGRRSPDARPSRGRLERRHPAGRESGVP
jgi:hypothetical protein